LNKILIYSVVAILLGVATMVAPLALLNSIDSGSEPAILTVTVPEGVEPAEKNDWGSARALDSEGLLNETLAAPEPTVPLAPIEPETGEYVIMVQTEASTGSGLSAVALMIVPSFLVALGAFVYLKRRMV